MSTAAPAPIPVPIGLPLVRLLRPRQWIKNAFVLAPLVFARDLASAAAWRADLLAVLAFCCAASALYIVNDLGDIVADRLHPVKRWRPLAAGTANRRPAVVLATACAAAAIAVAWGLPADFQRTLALYALLMLAYTWRLKRVPIADILVIASGFVLRVLAGSAAIHVLASHWMLLCTFLLAAFLACIKRKAEIAVMGGGSRGHRPALHGYSEKLADQIIAAMLAAAIIGYALYCVAPDTIARVGSDHLIYTLPIVIYTLLRYLSLAGSHLELAGDAEAALLGDHALQTGIAVWIVAVYIVLYWR